MLCKPLPIDEANTPSQCGAQRFRVRGADSYEELQERVLELAGRVWQLKDGLIEWLKTQPKLEMEVADTNTGCKLVGAGGGDVRTTIEEAAELCVPLLLCADLYNTYKHYDDCNRSRRHPFLNGVQFDTSTSGVCGIHYDGARKTGDITVANRNPVKFRIEIHSGNDHVNFGDAVVNIARAFKHWIPLIRSMGLLSPNDAEERAILDDLRIVDEAVATMKPFEPNDAAAEIHEVPVE